MSDNYSDFLASLNAFEINAATNVYDPVTLSTQITDLIGQLTDVYPDDPQQALIAQMTLFNTIGKGWPVIPLTTVSRQQQALNQQQIIDLIKNSSLTQMMLISSSITYTSRQDAINTLQSIEALLEPQLLYLADNSFNDSYNALNSARITMIQDINTRAATLKNTQYVKTVYSVPAFVFAYSQYSDSTQADDIVSRNKIVNPVFIPSNTTIEVLV